MSERASRVLMLGHAALGEVHHALAEFERIREVLADELGVDPSPQTRAAHLKVLQPVPTAPVRPPFVGRASELHWLSAVLDDVRSSLRDDAGRRASAAPTAAVATGSP